MIKSVAEKLRFFVRQRRRTQNFVLLFRGRNCPYGQLLTQGRKGSAFTIRKELRPLTLDLWGLPFPLCEYFSRRCAH